ncbi:DUF5644 domain-containing protein [Helicobacter sp. 13S00477-4]|uniref:DUF5644 domain-containing protein n=1 Tax=Helicobacter sp. 13S00477-4 TaxID=1905759 RepID=UPI000BA57520|nr:DUF5644 domain-containing protein [Helicobacter sp. 13S00477-4]PAF50807.1 hypothetical protein BKH44_06545 [Helicobacter sp. 13S00477-4]
MSSWKVELSVFRFDAQKDYNPCYEKCVIEYFDDDMLSGVLQSLPLKDFEYHRNIALKINNIAVFDDIKIIDLVKEFGQEWVLEPLSIRYAFKDLLIDREAVLGFYHRFLESGDFLSSDEKTELTKFININFISPQKNPEYYGDGFFLYIKWLLKRHPQQAKRLLESIGDVKNGVMNFVSVADFVYPKSRQIDKEIFEIQKMFTNGSRCPIKGNKWLNFTSKINEKYQFQKPIIGKPQEGIVYAIFDGYEKKINYKPLIFSVRAMFEKLGLKTLSLEFCFDGGYWGRFCDEEKFLFANAYNMALAHRYKSIFLLCDEDAYANILYAKKIIDSNSDVLEKINQKLKDYDLCYDNTVEIRYLNEMIVNDIKLKFSQQFNGFSTLMFGGSLTSQIDKICYKDFFKRMTLKRYEGSIQNESYAHLFEVSEESALLQSAEIRYGAIDLGVDFLLTLSTGQFEMFDTWSKKSSRYYKRDFDATPVLFLPELVLLAMGEKDPKKIGLHLHKNKVNFI